MTRVALPPVFNGFDTSGPTTCRPRNCEVGQPFWDVDLGRLFVFGLQGWELVNGDAIDAAVLAEPHLLDVVANPPAPESAVMIFDDGDDVITDDGDDPTDIDDPSDVEPVAFAGNDEPTELFVPAAESSR